MHVTPGHGSRPFARDNPDHPRLASREHAADTAVHARPRRSRPMPGIVWISFVLVSTPTWLSVTRSATHKISEWRRTPALCAEAVRWRNEPEALQPAQLLNDCLAHGVATLNSASSATNSAKTASAVRGPNIDRLKMNIAARSANRNTHPLLRIPELMPVTEHRRHRCFWITAPKGRLSAVRRLLVSPRT